MDPFHPEHVSLEEADEHTRTATASVTLPSPSPSPAPQTATAAPSPDAPSASPAASSASLSGVVLISPASRLAQLRSAAAIWRVVDLDSRRSEIDARALAVPEEEERATAARRSLAECTKAWKRLATEEEKCAALGPVVKAYQEEVNQLTRRAKASEAAFLQLFRLLHDAPDPFHLLSAATAQIEALQRVEDDLRTAKETLAEYEQEFSGLKDQSVTIRKLENEKREMETNLRALVAAQVAERARDAEEELQASRRAFDERERQLTDKLHSYQEQLAAALSAQSQLASVALSRDRQENERAELAASSDLRMLEGEVERQALELGRRENELSALRAQLRALESAPHAHAALDEAASLAAERARLEEELSAAQGRADTAEFLAREHSARAEQLAAALAAAQNDLAAADEKSNAAIAALRAELAEQPSRAQFDDLKRQLLSMQEIQYSSRNVDGESDAAAAGMAAGSDPAAAGASGSSSQTQMLLAKTRRLESELTTLKLTNSTLESSARTAVAEVDALQAQVAQFRALCARLEEDLAAANSNAVSGLLARSAATATAGAAKQLSSDLFSSAAAGTPAALGSLTPAGAKLLLGAGSGSGVEGVAAPPPSTTPVPGESDPAASGLSVDVAASSSDPLVSSLQTQLSQCSSMLSIVLSQRDRYRSKLDAMETEHASLVAASERARADAAALRKDNLALYEKMQFVKHSIKQDHRGDIVAASSSAADIESGFGGVGSGAMGRSGAGAGSADSSGSGSGASGGGGGGDSESKYAALYEARLNPFQAFKKRARAEREKSLSQSERVALAVGRALFSRKIARTALFAYALVLHLLVMVVLWTHTVANHCGGEGATAGKGGAHEH